MKYVLKYAFLAIALFITTQESIQAGFKVRTKTAYKSEKVQKIREALAVTIGLTAIPALMVFVNFMCSPNELEPDRTSFSIEYNICKNLYNLNFPGIKLLEDGKITFDGQTLKTFLGYGLSALCASIFISPSVHSAEKEESTLEVIPN